MNDADSETFSPALGESTEGNSTLIDDEIVIPRPRQMKRKRFVDSTNNT